MPKINARSYAKVTIKVLLEAFADMIDKGEINEEDMFLRAKVACLNEKAPRGSIIFEIADVEGEAYTLTVEPQHLSEKLN